MTTLAAIQMTSTRSLDDNLAQADALLQQAAGQGASLAVLPENFAGYGVDYRQLAGQYPRLVDWLSDQARRHRLAIVGGSIPAIERPDGSQVPAPRVRTRSLAFSEDGTLLAGYDKLHLFDAQVNDAQGSYLESRVFEPGEQVITVPLAGLQVGLAICYDLRFPALAQALAGQGAELLVYPSAFTAVTGAAHWQLLLRATAVQTGCFVLGANQCGQHSERRASFGHSMLVDPWGTVQASLEEKPGVLVATPDLATMDSVRQRMPVMRHQRFSPEGPYEL
ncbi:carbon-nitrogen hydrolase family protein [Alcanivorax hongdengensis A-11-3]|uniref:Carbon-nitrogen hydrolase family protein n=1 Tax=Alcanivorax hongdengensis A-11-3 TaxID=1177179 RepID=L0WEC8_9GAMM|nr:carbon-nitrogen hydrolase family protein [Alcanivorax hongdengensis]EKF74165.1 carbon-nitrogen hydrolase family protein [Alcanivorax hongdengensis A-11-3]